MKGATTNYFAVLGGRTSDLESAAIHFSMVLVHTRTGFLRGLSPYRPAGPVGVEFADAALGYQGHECDCRRHGLCAGASSRTRAGRARGDGIVCGRYFIGPCFRTMMHFLWCRLDETCLGRIEVTQAV